MAGKIIQIEPPHDTKVKKNRYFPKFLRHVRLAYPSNGHEERRHKMWGVGCYGRKVSILLLQKKLLKFQYYGQLGSQTQPVRQKPSVKYQKRSLFTKMKRALNHILIECPFSA